MQRVAERAEKEEMALRAVVRGTTALPDVLRRPQAIFQFSLHALRLSALLTWEITAARGYFPMHWGVSREWGDHAALANRSFWLACG